MTTPKDGSKRQPNRRQFLKTGAASGLSLAFAPLLAAPARHTGPKPRLPERVLAATQTPFTALPSTLPLSKPLADISMGRDGSVWGIDSDGVPHQYDQVAQSWQVYGSGFDAVGLVPDASTVVARGAEVSINGASPVSISSTWSRLPDTFAARLDGIATAQNTLFLFRHGRFVAINSTTKEPCDMPKALTIWFKGWPTTTPAWQAGAIEAVGSNPRDTNDPRVTFWTKDEYIVVNMASAMVIQGPRPVSSIAGAALSAQKAAGFDAVLVDPDAAGDPDERLTSPNVLAGKGANAVNGRLPHHNPSIKPHGDRFRTVAHAGPPNAVARTTLYFTPSAADRRSSATKDGLATIVDAAQGGPAPSW